MTRLRRRFRRLIFWSPEVALVTLFLTALAPAARSAPAEARADGPKLAHTVFFTLKDHSAESRDRFVKSCHKYLGGHEGTVFFEVGVIAEDVSESVSVKDFDVALHLVFESKEAEAKYLKDPRHVKFVEENKGAWSKVRVFDTYIAAKGQGR